MLAVTDTGTGHGRGDADADLRAVFHDQRHRQRHGSRTLHGVRHRQPERRSYLGDSEVGQGTSFKIYFPRVDGRADVELGALQRAPCSSVATILLVEDDDAVRRVAARILRKQGYTVLETHGPSEAREICGARGKEIDLLLTDVVMPETSGPDLAKELSALCPRMRVVFISGYPEYRRNPRGFARSERRLSRKTLYGRVADRQGAGGARICVGWAQVRVAERRLAVETTIARAPRSDPRVLEGCGSHKTLV